MLTDTQCRAARPREKAYKLADGGGRAVEQEGRHQFLVVNPALLAGVPAEA